MFIYIVIFGFSVLLMHLYQCSSNKAYNMFYLFTVFSLLFLLLSLRYNTGADYQSYVRNIEDARKDKDYFCFEIGWAPLIFFMVSLNIDSHFFFIITGCLSILLILQIIPKENACVCICLYMALGYIETFSITRQCFAAIIFSYAYSKYLKNNKKIQFYLMAIIASLFHTSFVILVLILPIVLLIADTKLIKLSQRKVFLSFVVLFIMFSVVNFGNFILDKVLKNSPYAIYGKMGEIAIGKTKNNTGFGMILRYILCFSVAYNHSILSGKELPKKEKINNLLTLVLYSFFLLSNQIIMFMRLPLILNTSLVVFYENQPTKIRRLKKLFVILICFLLFIATLLKSSKGVENSWKLTPYTSILNKLW